ncbi:MAG: Fic family protein [Deltaproteobacteria bacterium]|jgi:Fic family protein|nr:Fic family protein [Deltaproteobacteria bacterium]
MAEIYHKWEPITDLPDGYRQMSDPSFDSAAQEWASALTRMNPGKLADFRERTMREWAVETGKVERIYRLDDEITRRLVDHGLTSEELPVQTDGLGPVDPALVLENHRAITVFMNEEIEMGRPLTNFAIKGMHSVFVENQDFAAGRSPTGERIAIRLLKGTFKKWPNNPHTPEGLLHQYCPPEQVDIEMERLLAMHASHASDSVPPDIEAAWLHHRFIQIHPFQDGNGRIARALASMEYMKSGLLPPVVTDKGRDAYIDTLDKANRGELQPFVRYLSGLAVKTMRECIAFAART